MKRIAYYISDVGWGHAARSIEVVKALKRLGRCRFLIVNSSAKELLKAELSQEEHMESPNPKEPGWGSEYIIDREGLKSRIREWALNLERAAEGEAERVAGFKPDLVICDVNPVAPLVAERLKVPCVVVSNFNWWDEYMHMFEDEDLLKPLKRAYDKSHWNFILPLESENRAFRLKERVELVAKEHDAERVREIRRKLIRTYRPEIIAMVAAGGWKMPLPTSVERAMEEASRKAKILWVIPHGLSIKSEGLTTHWLSKGSDFRNTLAACDFVISKYGYSTASEALISRIPMLLIYRPEVPEDSFATEDLVMSGCALRFPYWESISIPLETIHELKCHNRSSRLENRGAQRIATRIWERFL